VHAVPIVIGTVVVLVALTDATATLVTTRPRKGRWWPTTAFYRVSWRFWRQLGLRRKDVEQRERVLGAYGPLSLLMLLVIWVTMEILGWALIWYGTRSRFNQIHSFYDSIYYSGVTFFTVGFGDIVPLDGAARILAVVAALTGIATSALVIGFLPTLYTAYSERERQLLTLDDLSGTYVTPLGLIELHARPTDTSDLDALFQRWEQWMAMVMESHTAYRVLVLTRSRRAGQSWLTAIGVVADAAVTMIAVVRGSAKRAPLLLYRRSTELVGSLNLTAAPPLDKSVVAGGEDDFRHRYEHLRELGFDLRPYDEAWSAVRQLREAYIPQLVQLSWYLLSPGRFRNPEVPYPEVLASLAAEDGETTVDDEAGIEVLTRDEEPGDAGR
jgi:hypothetical protein